MKWSGDLAARGSAAGGPLRTFIGWISGGFAAIARPEADVSEREMRRIRAKQMVAVTQLVPVTMTVNLITVSIVVGLFWGGGENAFLALWAMAIAGVVSLAARSWMRSHANPPERGIPARNTQHCAAGVPPGRRLGRVAACTFSKGWADRPDDHRLPDGGNDRRRRLYPLDGSPRGAGLYLDHDLRLRRRRCCWPTARSMFSRRSSCCCLPSSWPATSSRTAISSWRICRPN